MSRSTWTAKYDATAEPGPKYGNKIGVCSEGRRHQSRLEARRCTELHLMQKGGLIRDLEAHPQPRLSLEVAGKHIADYMPDFRYTDCETERQVIEDTKGVRTDAYRLKRRLVEALYPDLDFREVRREGIW